MNHFGRTTAKIATITLLLLLGEQARAGTRRDDVADSLHTSLAATYPSTLPMNLGPTLYNATVIDPHWVITAGHTGTPDFQQGYTLTINSVEYRSSRVFRHPEFAFNSSSVNGDLSLIYFASPLMGVTPARLISPTDPSEIGQTGTYVANGFTGTGLTGDTIQTRTMRAGQNVIDFTGDVFTGVNNRTLIWDFDSPAGDTNTLESLGSSPTALALEYGLASWDSGGSLYVDFGSGPVLAGVGSFVATGNTIPNLGEYGDVSGFTRLRDYHGWIVTTIPEPSPLPLVGAAGLAGAAVRYARRRPMAKSPTAE